MKDYDFYVRDSAGRPTYFVQHHETHSHNGMCPHEHWIDLISKSQLKRTKQNSRCTIAAVDIS